MPEECALWWDVQNRAVVKVLDCSPDAANAMPITVAAINPDSGTVLRSLARVSVFDPRQAIPVLVPAVLLQPSVQCFMEQVAAAYCADAPAAAAPGSP